MDKYLSLIIFVNIYKLIFDIYLKSLNNWNSCIFILFIAYLQVQIFFTISIKKGLQTYENM
jgi:hypothetical protein